MERDVDGILISTLDFKSNILDKLRMNRFPHIFVSCKLSGVSSHYVIGDEYQGEREAVEYLINLGHRNIAFLRGPNMFPANQKLLAYKDVMKEHNINIKDYFISSMIYNLKGGRDVTLELLSNHKDITAILAVNDMIAIGATKALENLGLSIPDDISIIGCDNIEAASLLKVPLTTINYPKFRCGNIATKMLIDYIEGKIQAKKKEVILSCKLVIRKSCAPLKKSL
jgi:LacI family transcriptional regulator